jgi:ActD protein
METLGIFSDVESAARAADALVRSGFTEAQIDSLTSVPYPDGVLVKRKGRTWFRWIALAGGLSGAAAGFALAAGTAWVYPVQTGDKPIIALYPTAIVTFEVTMVSAIIGAMVGMFLEMGLPSLRKRPYDPAIAEGCIGISVTIHGGGEVVECGAGVQAEECIGITASLPAEEQMSLAEEVMLEAGAMRIIPKEST